MSVKSAYYSALSNRTDSRNATAVPYVMMPGLAGKFFNGDWRGTISTGNIGTYPLTSNNDSSNITGSGGMPSADHRYGVNRWEYITYTTLGEAYGFIALGYFTPTSSGNHSFWTSTDDSSGLWLGDLALPGASRTSANATLNNNLGVGQGNTKRGVTVSLTAGIRYPVRLVMEEGGGGDNMTFSWSGPGIGETTNLATHFTTPTLRGKLLGAFI